MLRTPSRRARRVRITIVSYSMTSPGGICIARSVICARPVIRGLGQNWHNLLREAPLCFIGNVGSHGHVVFKKLQNLDKNLDGKISTAAEENGQESTSDEEKWIIGVQRTLEEAKTSLKLCDMAGAVAKNGLDLLSKAGNARKGDVLTKWQDALQQNMKTALDTGRATDAILAKVLECLEEAKSRWRCIESMQSALEGIDMRVEGKKLGANYVSDVALPLVLRMQLAQPIMSGDDAADFCVAERLDGCRLWIMHGARFIIGLGLQIIDDRRLLRRTRIGVYPKLGHLPVISRTTKRL